MFSPRKLRLVKKLIPHLIMWVMGGTLYVLLEHGLLGESTSYPSTGNPYDFGQSFVSVLVLGIVAGSTFGLFEELLFKDLLSRRPFGLKVVVKTVFYEAFLIIILIVFTAFINSVSLDVPLFHHQIADATIKFVSNFAFASVVIYSSVLIGLSLFISEIIDHIGLNAITNFFTGRYSKSKVEDRVFMFLDMKSSTTIAEKLGHEQYYQLLNNYYSDMTNAVIDTAAEIYQYVGDEIVVSWEYAPGVENNNCLRCFFLIKDQIEKRSSFYQQKFGVVPGFKAGLHHGKVTAGEVGLIKKEILFTGDVLNTSARIQGLCNELGVDLLISADLANVLNIEGAFDAEAKGSFELRGRDQRIELFAVERA